AHRGGRRHDRDRRRGGRRVAALHGEGPGGRGRAATRREWRIGIDRERSRSTGSEQERGMDEISRRGFLAALGASGATWVAFSWGDVLAAGAHAARVATDDSPPPFEVLTPEQAEEIEAIAAQIIPSDGTPGAREARVVHF